MWQGFLASIGFVVVQMPLGLKLSIVEFRDLARVGGSWGRLKQFFACGSGRC